MRVKFRFHYDTELNGNREAVEALVRKPIEFGDDGRVKSWTTYEADLRSLLKVVPASQIQLADMDAGGLADLVEAIDQLRSRVEAMQPALNERVQVVVRGLSLMEMRHVVVRTDYCTDELQGDLNDGWRILAICPQPDQRRPDYILGRADEPAW